MLKIFVATPEWSAQPNCFDLVVALAKDDSQALGLAQRQSDMWDEDLDSDRVRYWTDPYEVTIEELSEKAEQFFFWSSLRNEFEVLCLGDDVKCFHDDESLIGYVQARLSL